MTSHRLPGLRAQPLGSYLTGLGVLRVLGEQADPRLTAWWDDVLHLDTTVDDLPGWLAESYVPTPVVSPWNKDGVPRRQLEKLCALPTARLDGLRRAVAAIERIDGITDKETRVRQFRNWCPEELLPWLDAAVAVTSGELRFPPLLGTGGLDGRLEFSRAFLEHLWAVFEPGPPATARSKRWAGDLLHGTSNERLVSASIGQFDPAAAGGKNSSPFGVADSLVNPWGYVLMLEGTLMFAASVARRYGPGESSRAAMPFTVDASPHGGHSGAQDEASRGEVWTPLWEEPFSYQEVRQLFGESRASWKGRPARRAIDFYQATVTHGVSRGISAFHRYGLHERNGRAYVAVPLDRVRVTERPAVMLAGQVEDWVSGLRGAQPHGIRQAVRRFDLAQLEFARTGSPLALRVLLAARTDVEFAVARSGGTRQKIRPADTRSAEPFLRFFQDVDGPALRIAAGLVSARRHREPYLLRHLLLPVHPHRREWTDSPIVAGYGVRPLPAVLAEVLAWRSRTVPSGENTSSTVRGVAPLTGGIAVPDADLHRWLSEPALDREIDEWVRALLTLDWRKTERSESSRPAMVRADLTLALLAVLSTGLRSTTGSGDERFGLGADWARRLIADQTSAVRRDAARRLRQAGWVVPAAIAPTGGVRLAAALAARPATPTRTLELLIRPQYSTNNGTDTP